MDRWRRVPDDLGSTHVRVNVPEFRLRVFENGESRLDMRTIVGAPDTQTPVFSDRIRYLVFNPYWNVPDSIVQDEIASKAAEDPSELEEEGFEALSGWDDDAEAIDPSAVDWEADRIGYRVRQRPGPENALGLVKFRFPNRYGIAAPVPGSGAALKGATEADPIWESGCEAIGTIFEAGIWVGVHSPERASRAVMVLASPIAQAALPVEPSRNDRATSDASRSCQCRTWTSVSSEPWDGSRPVGCCPRCRRQSDP